MLCSTLSISRSNWEYQPPSNVLRDILTSRTINLVEITTENINFEENDND